MGTALVSTAASQKPMRTKARMRPKLIGRCGRGRLYAFFLLFVATVALAPPAVSQDQSPAPSNVNKGRSEFELQTGIGFSDNIRRAARNEVDTAYLDFGSTFDWAAASRRTRAALDGALIYREFERQSEDSILLGDVEALVELDIFSDVLRWSISDRFGQARVDDFLPGSPGNLQNINTFNTGPTLTLPLGRRSEFELQGEFSVRTFEDVTRADSELRQGRIRYRRLLSPQSSVGIAYQTRQIEFKNPGSSEFDVDSYFLTVDLDKTARSINVEIGFDSADTNRGIDEGLRARIAVAQKIGAYSSFELEMGREITENGGLLNDSTVEVFARQDQLNAIDDLLRRTTLQAGFRIDRPRLNAGVSVGWIDDEFDTQELNDIERYIANLQIERRMSRRHSLGLAAMFQRRDFAVAGERNDEWQAIASYGYDVGRRTSLAFRYTHRRLHGSQRPDFIENQLSLDLIVGLGRE